MTRMWTVPTLLVGVLLSGCSAGLPAGEPCTTGVSCASGLCSVSEVANPGELLCLDRCAGDVDCGIGERCLALPSGEMACQGCTFDTTNVVCTSEGPFRCDELPPDENCAVCGCSMDARCVAGVCEPLREVGAACTYDAECQSEYCEGITCAPRADFGMPCTRDLGCLSSNCTSLPPGAPGTCEVAFGASCTVGGPECTNCEQFGALTLCFNARRVCTEGGCPDGWSCVAGTGTSERFCYQRCEADMPCLDRTETCQVSGPRSLCY